MGESNEKDDEWSFEVDESQIPSEDSSVPKKRKIRPRTLRRDKEKKPKEAELKLGFDDVPKRVSRSKADEYIHRDTYSKGKDVDTSMSTYMDRLQAFAIDGVLALVLWMVSKHTSIYINDPIVELLEKVGAGSVAKLDYFGHIPVGILFFILYFFFFVIPLAFTSQSLGKKISKIVVDDEDGGFIGFSRTFMREVVLKPISLASGIGILLALFNKRKQGLHDLIIKTVVRKKY